MYLFYMMALFNMMALFCMMALFSKCNGNVFALFNGFRDNLMAQLFDCNDKMFVLYDFILCL